MGARLNKVVINMGLGLDGNDRKILNICINDLAQISGQKPVVTKAKKAIATYKLREGMIVGCMVTLRRERAYEFLDRLVHERIEDVTIFIPIAMKWIEDELFGPFGNLFVIAQDEHGPDGLAFAPGRGQVRGNCSDALEGFGRDVVRKHFFALADDGLEFLVHVNHVVLRRLGHTEFRGELGFVQFLAPSIVFILGLTVFGEELHPAQAFCFGCIWLAAAIFVWDLLARRKPRKPTPVS